MMEKFTKGPWRTEQRKRGLIVLASSENLNAGFSICAVNGPESEANATLIAAAPEMYEMLKLILSVYEMDYDDTDKALKLLAKARGEQ